VGFLPFDVHNVSPGQHIAVTIVLKLLPGESVNQYWMYGSPGLDSNSNPLPKQWYRFDPYDPVTDTGADINGNVITLHFVDGLRGDDDLNADGVIQDPGGPAIVRAPRLSWNMNAAPVPDGPGRQPEFAIAFTTTVTNRSSISAPGVVVTDPLPAGVAFVSASSNQGSCVFNGSTVVCNLGTLAPGASDTIRLVLRPLAIGPVTNTAKLFDASVDPMGGRTVATVTAIPLPAGRLNRFVTSLYAEILDRFPEPRGLAYWVGRLKSSASPRSVARAIYRSAEHHGLLRHHLAPNFPLGWSYLVAVRAERWRIPGVPAMKELATRGR
jgi:uncharacterized repeat protein (TIGR01451 family)